MLLLQLWLIVLLVVSARASASARMALTVSLAALTASVLPSNLWRPQLKRMGTLALLIFVFTAIGAGTYKSQGWPHHATGRIDQAKLNRHSHVSGHGQDNLQEVIRSV